MYVSVPYLDFLKTRRGSITLFGLFEHFFRTIKVSCQSKQGFDTILGFFEMATLTEDLISKAMRLLLLEMRVLDWFIAEDALPFMAISKMFMFASLSRLLQPFRVGYDANDFSQVTLSMARSMSPSTSCSTGRAFSSSSTRPGTNIPIARNCAIWVANLAAENPGQWSTYVIYDYAFEASI